MIITRECYVCRGEYYHNAKLVEQKLREVVIPENWLEVYIDSSAASLLPLGSPKFIENGIHAGGIPMDFPMCSYLNTKHA